MSLIDAIKVRCKGTAIRIRAQDKAIVEEMRRQGYNDFAVADVLAILQREKP